MREITTVVLVPCLTNSFVFFGMVILFRIAFDFQFDFVVSTSLFFRICSSIGAPFGRTILTLSTAFKSSRHLPEFLHDGTMSSYLSHVLLIKPSFLPFREAPTGLVYPPIDSHSFHHHRCLLTSVAPPTIMGLKI